MGTIDPLMFRFFMTYNILLIIVLGEWEALPGQLYQPYNNNSPRGLEIPGRAAFPEHTCFAGLEDGCVFNTSNACGFVLQAGIMGTREFSWDKFIKFFARKPLSKRMVPNNECIETDNIYNAIRIDRCQRIQS